MLFLETLAIDRSVKIAQQIVTINNVRSSQFAVFCLSTTAPQGRSRPSVCGMVMVAKSDRMGDSCRSFLHLSYGIHCFTDKRAYRQYTAGKYVYGVGLLCEYSLYVHASEHMFQSKQIPINAFSLLVRMYDFYWSICSNTC